MYFQMFEPLAALESSQTRELAERERKRIKRRFSSISKLLVSRVELHLEKADFQLRGSLVSVLWWPGLVSVCD